MNNLLCPANYHFREQILTNDPSLCCMGLDQALIESYTIASQRSSHRTLTCFMSSCILVVSGLPSTFKYPFFVWMWEEVRKKEI